MISLNLSHCLFVCLFILTWDIFSLLLERERKKHQCERETLICCLLVHAPNGDRTWNQAMCPDQKLNIWPLGLWGESLTNWTTPSRATPPILNPIPKPSPRRKSKFKSMEYILQQFFSVYRTPVKCVSKKNFNKNGIILYTQLCSLQFLLKTLHGQPQGTQI